MNILIYIHLIIIREYKIIAFTLNKVIAQKTNLLFHRKPYYKRLN